MKERLRRLGRKIKLVLDRYYRDASPYLLSRREKLAALGLAAFFLLLYLYTCSHAPNIAGDSPELIGTSYSLGIAHPPGYPLYTLMGYIFTHIPVGSVAFRLNFFSALLHSLALFIFFVSLLKITRSLASSAIATTILGFSSLFWFYSLVAEVFPLNDFFAVLLIYVAIRVRERWVEGNQKGSRRLFFLLAFLCGLSMCNHHTILLIFPALVLFTLYPLAHIIRRPRFLLYSVLLFALGLIPYIYLPIRAAQGPYLNFGDPATFHSFVDVITREHYGTTQLWHGPAATHRLDVVFGYLKTLGQEIYLPGLLLGVIGMFRSARKRRCDFIPLLTAFIFTGIVFLLMANVEVSNVFYSSTIERFYLVPTIIFLYFVGFGVSAVIDWVRGVLSRLDLRSDLRRGLLWVIVLLVALPFLLPAKATSAEVNLKYDVLGESYINNLTASLEEGALIFVEGDVPIQLMEYYQTVVGDRKDIITIIYPFLFEDWYLKTLTKWHPDLKLPSQGDIPEEVLSRLPVFKAWMIDYIIHNNPQIPNFYVLTRLSELEGVKQLLPWGISYKILPPDQPFELDEYLNAQLQYWKGFDNRGMVRSTYREGAREREMIDFIAHYPNQVGNLLNDMGHDAEAISFYKLAYSISPAIDVLEAIAAAYLEMDKPEEAFGYVLQFLQATSIYEQDFFRALVEVEDIMMEQVVENER